MLVVKKMKLGNKVYLKFFWSKPSWKNWTANPILWIDEHRMVNCVNRYMAIRFSNLTHWINTTWKNVSSPRVIGRSENHTKKFWPDQPVLEGIRSAWIVAPAPSAPLLWPLSSDLGPRAARLSLSLSPTLMRGCGETCHRDDNYRNYSVHQLHQALHAHTHVKP